MSDSGLSANLKGIDAKAAGSGRPRKQIIIGDIHGCYDELLHLLKKAGLPDMVSDMTHRTSRYDHAIVCVCHSAIRKRVRHARLIGR